MPQPTDNLKLFIPINKIDEEQRLVYGQVAAEVLDNAGEVFDYDGSKEHFEKWSDNAFATSGGKSYGNVRVMHTSKVAGIVASPLAFDDEAKTIDAVAKVVDDAEWNMVLAGGYTGFSMGGRYVKRLTKGTEKRYVAAPVEISLVDKPCIPTATFEVIKADGIVEEREFHPELVEEAMAKADDSGDEPYGDVTYADPGYQEDGKKRYPIDTAAHIRSAWSYISRSSNADKYSAADLKKVKNKIISAWKSKIDKDGPPSAAEKSDSGDEHMYVPTNDEILPVAKALAKAAGKGDDQWVDFADAARDQIVAEKADQPAGEDDAAKADGHDVEKCDKADCPDCAAAKADKPNPFADKDKKDDDKDGDDGDDADGDEAKDDKDKEAAKKGDLVEGDEVEQGWRATDGQFFAKKADALAHNAELKKASEPSVLDELRKTVDAASKIGTEDAEPAGDAEPDPEVEKAARLEAVAAPLAKFKEFLDANLAKGLYSLTELTRVVECLDYVHSSLTYDNTSPISDELLANLTSLGKTLVELANDEVAKIVARAKVRGVPEVEVVAVVELAAGTLGLEKADFEEQVEALVKADLPEGEPLAKVDDAGTLAKVETLEQENAVLKRDMDEIVPLVKTLSAELERIKALPQPKAPTTVVEKGEGTGLPPTKEDLLQKFTPEQLTDAAIRMSQQNGRSMVLPHGMPA